MTRPSARTQQLSMSRRTSRRSAAKGGSNRKNRLANALILIRCTKKSHRDCRPIRDALLDKFPGVIQSFTTDAKFDGIEWCVVGNALINVAERDKIESDLRRLKTDSKRPVGVSNLLLAVDTR